MGSFSWRPFSKCSLEWAPGEALADDRHERSLPVFIFTRVAQLSKSIHPTSGSRACISGERFEVGDIVQLKSGGPDMAVENGHFRYGQLRCQWFEKNEVKYGLFKPEDLTAAGRRLAQIRKPGAE
ncbi:MAG: YodC family protein [Gemmatimonadaceae bacterium]